MIRIYALLFFIILSIESSAQKVIQMENVNGVYRISCSVNGAKMKMIFDTGASTVSLSESMATFLYDNGYISKEDVLGTSKSKTADGSIHDNVVINIKDIEISGLHIKNVQAVVLSSQNAPLLLGQSAIQKLGHISLKGNKLIINDYQGDYTSEEVDRIADLAFKYYDDGSYYACIDNFQKIIDYIDLKTYGYYILVNCYYQTEQYDKVIEYAQEWERKFGKEKPSIESSSIITNYATVLTAIKNQHREALSYFEKLVSIDTELGLDVGNDYLQIALTYCTLSEYSNSIPYFKKALKYFFELNKTSENIINTKGIDNQSIGNCLYFYALALYDNNDTNSGNYIMSLSAKCNYEKAIKYCYEHDINFKSRQTLFD